MGTGRDWNEGLESLNKGAGARERIESSQIQNQIIS
jgi:hypothetical protein